MDDQKVSKYVSEYIYWTLLYTNRWLYPGGILKAQFCELLLQQGNEKLM